MHCAIAVQKAMAEREAESPQDQRIQFRIGINLGDIIVDGEVTSDSKFYDHVWLAASYAHMGYPDKAKEHGRRVLELAPNFTIGRFQRLERYKSKADLERWVTGLRKAGLPA